MFVNFVHDDLCIVAIEFQIPTGKRNGKWVVMLAVDGIVAAEEVIGGGAEIEVEGLVVVVVPSADTIQKTVVLYFDFREATALFLWLETASRFTVFYCRLPWFLVKIFIGE
ncbi:hypothetical protein EUGRSUZ_F04143 [Eucalyptus grandis]|uniref:Uncharacterized protein n=2 Tax=Eucalyptus grandis TaxID=71139 RepID=A0ACC3KPP2_EUCGR|nr:hypothetical protein EUGRSUZ_F04143 [Eucalyptus grandis]